MEQERRDIYDKEVNRIIEVCKSDFDWIELLGDSLKNVADVYRISKVHFEVYLPATPIRHNPVIVDKTFFDDGKSSETSDIIEDRRAPGKGTAIVTLYSESGHTWSEEERKEILTLLHVLFIHTSQYLTTQMINKTMETDLATGLYNQEGFFAYISQCFARNEANEYFLMFFNVCNFKYVNKIFSYQEGDIVLSKYGKAIGKLVEGDECIGRMGGDNFVAYIHKDHIYRFIEQLDHVVIEHEANNTHKRFEFSATKGVASADSIPDCRVIMGHSAMAYQSARRSHKPTVFFSEELYANVVKQQDVILRFHDALEAGEFVVYYQPKVDTEKYELCGAEALVRWIREDGLHMPMEFVPVFEENGNIRALDYYVLETVCKQLESWRHSGMILVPVSVNFSRRHLEEDHFVEKVAEIISKYDIDPQFVEVELTESDNFQDYSIMSRVVVDLKNIGVSTSIDDFGTGYSSLNMLKSTEFDIVKIDRSFIPMERDSAAHKAKNMAMFKSIMELINLLGMDSIAEGVETKEQLQYFASSKCRMVQGYIFDRPLPCEEFEKRLVSRSYTI